MAIPTSALTSAGASFIPSPIIATFLPASWSFLTSFSLSCGKTSAITLLTFICLPIASAVFLLSPVSIITSIPILSNSCIAFSLVGLTTSATAIIPKTSFSFAKNIGVFPSEASFWLALSNEDIEILLLSNSFLFPM